MIGLSLSLSLFKLIFKAIDPPIIGTALFLDMKELYSNLELPIVLPRWTLPVVLPKTDFISSLCSKLLSSAMRALVGCTETFLARIT